jgi:hypothetical protein
MEPDAARETEDHDPRRRRRRRERLSGVARTAVRPPEPHARTAPDVCSAAAHEDVASARAWASGGRRPNPPTPC